MAIKKSFIIIYGKQNEGKSDIIKRVSQQILSEFGQNATIKAINPNPLNYGGDILVTIQLPTIKIGFESQGDPNSRIIRENTLEDLITKEKCDLVICASRTSGSTVDIIDKLANRYGFSTLWRSSYYAPGFNHAVINQKAAVETVELIKMFITEQIN